MSIKSAPMAGEVAKQPATSTAVSLSFIIFRFWSFVAANVFAVLTTLYLGLSEDF